MAYLPHTPLSLRNTLVCTKFHLSTSQATSPHRKPGGQWIPATVYMPWNATLFLVVEQSRTTKKAAVEIKDHVLYTVVSS